MFGRHHRFGPESHAHFFERGDLKYVILSMLEDKPSHGYEIMHAIEEHFRGFYTPSAGTIYPTLQMLDDMGHVKSVEQEGKKVYSITESGKAFLKEHKDTFERIRGHMHAWGGGKDREDTRDALIQLTMTLHGLRRHSHQLPPEKLAKIKDILTRATADLKALDV